jgi:two-component system NtrC family response regulator/two-component system response regulator HydG
MKRRVLVVDDDRNAREALRTLLEEEGYVVRTAADGIAAFAALAAFPPDVVVADVHMPRMNGRALYDALRQLPGASPKIIFMSAEPRFDDTALFLSKPIAFDELLALLRE